MRTSHSHSPSSDQEGKDSLWRRVDRAAGAMNAFLIALAIGLMVLDVTFFAAIKITQLPAFQAAAADPAPAPVPAQR
jgi:hypothetical protein